MEFHGRIQNGVVTFSPIVNELRQRLLTSLKDGTFVRETIKKVGPQKTHQQVKAHFGLVVERIRQRFIDMGVDVCGIPPNKDMVHDILKKACGGVGEMGETLGLSQMTIEQCSQFFENCRTWAATQLQLDIPDPKPNMKTSGVKAQGRVQK